MDGPRLSQQQEGTTYSLVLRDVAQHDAGVYTCLAHNAGGQVLCKAELLVHGGEWGTPSQACLGSMQACGAVGMGVLWAPTVSGTIKLGDRETGWSSLLTPTASPSLATGDSAQSSRRKLHSFYEVKEEIGRYCLPPIPAPGASPAGPPPPKTLIRNLPEFLPQSFHPGAPSPPPHCTPTIPTSALAEAHPAPRNPASTEYLPPPALTFWSPCLLRTLPLSGAPARRVPAAPHLPGIPPPPVPTAPASALPEPPFSGALPPSKPRPPGTPPPTRCTLLPGVCSAS